MGRLFHVLFSVTAMLSLLLSAAVTALWVRSHFVAQSLKWLGSDNQHVAWIASSQGEIAFSSITLRGSAYVARNPDSPTFFLREGPPSKLTGQSPLKPGRSAPRDMIWAGIGFRAINETDAYSSTHALMLFAPHWLVVVLAMVLPAVRLMRWRRRRKALAEPAACPACGYDCRATPDRCPECGRNAAAG